MDVSKNQMTQGISQQHVTSCPSASIFSAKLGDVLALLFQHYIPTCFASLLPQQLHALGETQDSRELHWAPKNPGLHRQRPGFTHTSSCRQASGPSQMAEKHPTQVGRTGAQPGDTLPPHWLPGPCPLKGCCSPQEVCVSQDGPYCQGSGLEIGPRKAGRSLACVLPSL